MNNSGFPDGFEKMIVSKRFAELSEAELKQISAEDISEAEYEQIRATLLSLNELDEDIPEPSEDLKDSLLKAFNEGKVPATKIIRFPYWVISGIAASILIAVFFIAKPFEKELKKEVSQANPTSARSDSSDKNKSVTDSIQTVAGEVAQPAEKGIPNSPDIIGYTWKNDLPMGSDEVDDAPPAVENMSETNVVNDINAAGTSEAKFIALSEANDMPASVSMGSNTDLLSLTVAVY